MLDSFPHLVHFIAVYGYIALYGIVFVGGTYLPIPGGLFVIAAGALAHAGYFNIFIAYLICLAAGISADLLPFSIARTFEKNRHVHTYIENHKYTQKIKTYMHKYPKSTIFVSRFFGFASMPVNLIAGFSKIKLLTFLAMDSFANIICTLLYFSAGYAAGRAALHGTHLSIIIGIILTAMAAMYAITFFIWERLKP